MVVLPASRQSRRRRAVSVCGGSVQWDSRASHLLHTIVRLRQVAAPAALAPSLQPPPNHGPLSVHFLPPTTTHSALTLGPAKTTTSSLALRPPVLRLHVSTNPSVRPR